MTVFRVSRVLGRFLRNLTTA